MSEPSRVRGRKPVSSNLFFLSFLGVTANGLCGDGGKVDEVSVILGEKVDIVVELTNPMLGRALDNLSLEVRPFVPSAVESPTSLVSTIGSLLANCVAVVGLDSVIIPRIPIAGLHSHRVGFVFCSPGTYKLAVRCRPVADESIFKTVPIPVWEHVPALDIVVRE